MRMKGLLFGKRNRVIKLLLILILLIYSIHVINQVLSFHLVVNSVIYFSNDATKSKNSLTPSHENLVSAKGKTPLPPLVTSFPITSPSSHESMAANASSSSSSHEFTSCPKKEHIMFMKTHKCGSSSLQNMFLRFGDTNDLFFALPKIDNYFGHPIRFNRRFLLDPALLRKRYNLTYSILAHHLRFNYKELAFVLPEDTVFLTVLRHPVSLFESLFVYYDYAVASLGVNVSLHEFALMFDRDPRFSPHAASPKDGPKDDELAVASRRREGRNEDGQHVLLTDTTADANHSKARSWDREGGSRATGQSIASSSSSPTQKSARDDGTRRRRSGWSSWSSFFQTLLLGPMTSTAGGGDGQADGGHHQEARVEDGNDASPDAEAGDDKLGEEEVTGAEDDHNDGHYMGLTPDQRKRRINGSPASLRSKDSSPQTPRRPDPNFRVGGRFGRNQMSFDLGFNQKFFDSPNIVNNFIDAIDSMFHLVLIQERMDESLILLKHLLCWSTLDVVTFRHNVRAEAFTPAPRLGLTPKSRQILQNLNFADHMMYEHFYAKFDSIVKAFGSERMEREVRELQHLTQQLYSQCVDSTQIMANIVRRTSSPSDKKRNKEPEEGKLWSNEKAVGMIAKAGSSPLCQQLTHSELEYTEILRKKQQVFLRNNKKLLNNFNSLHHILMNPPESHGYKHDRNFQSRGL